MSHIFHPREQHYPPKSFEIEVKGRKFFIDARGGYGAQLGKVTGILESNGIESSAAMGLCVPHWCNARPELCKGETVRAPSKSLVSRAVEAVRSIVSPKRKPRGRGCSSCGGGSIT